MAAGIDEAEASMLQDKNLLHQEQQLLDKEQRLLQFQWEHIDDAKRQLDCEQRHRGTEPQQQQGSSAAQHQQDSSAAQHQHQTQHQQDSSAAQQQHQTQHQQDSSAAQQHQQQPPERPFAHLRLAPSDFLDAAAAAAGGRSACPGCGRSRKFYCHACCVPVPPGQPLPSVSLPVAVRIVKHPAEFHGKSTSPHAVLLAPGSCRIVRYPLLPPELLQEAGATAVVFPAAEGAISVAELAARIAAEAEAAAVEGGDGGDIAETVDVADRRQKSLEERMSRWTFIFVDSTWHQANAIVNDDRLRGLPRVALGNQQQHASHYWRHEDGLTPGHLSTIEAIYYLCTDLHLALCQLGYYQSAGCSYDGRYDNLLLYLNHLYQLLYRCYDGGRACGDRKRKHFKLK